MSPASDALAKQLHDALEQAGMQPFRDDRDVESDEPWALQILTALGACNAAVLLLTPEIVGVAGPPAPWVLQEATVLSWRKSLQPDFRLFTVLLGGLTVPGLQKSSLFAPLQLTDRQLRLEDGLEALFDDLQTLAREMTDLHPEALREQEVQLKLETLRPKLLAGLRRKLHLDNPGWCLEATWRDTLAKQVARELTQQDPVEPDGVADVLIAELTGHMEPSDMEHIVDAVAPGWVPAEAARAFRAIVDPSRNAPPDSGRLEAAMVPVASQPGVELYAYRAAGKPKGWKVVGLTGEHSGENAEAELLKELARALQKKGYRKDDDSRTWGRRPWLVTLPRGAVNDRTLKKLREEHPSCTFVLFDETADAPGGVTTLHPRPNPSDAAYQEICQIARDMVHGEE
ncbi:MAG: toll/interleukin-1 receptor domain-containing protein [Alphaproteobacteria bacterium]|nr:toll/interleukin-1 receptor domain-containing protein [Alphaproteobacteria bacterium]